MGHFKMRQFCDAEFKLHMAPVCNPLGIFHSLPCIGKKSLHLFFTFHIILPAHITHPVLVCQLFPGLDTKKDVVRLYIIRIGIMHIIGYHQRNVKFPAHLKKCGIHHFLFRQSVILQFQKKIIFSKAVPIFKRGLFRLIHKSLLNISLYFSCKAGGKCNNSLMKPV